MSNSVLVKKRVLIVGNGAAGSQLAAKLVKNKTYHVIVLTPLDYQEVSLCMTKAIAVGPEEHAKIIYPLLREENVEYVMDQCTSINDNTASVASGAPIPFDICIIATGQNIPIFYPDIKDTTQDARKASVSKIHSDVVRANDIVISGGGPVGSELAADIKLRNKGKR